MQFANYKCGSSYLRIGDILPSASHDAVEYIAKIERVVSKSRRTVGWVYVGNLGHKIAEATVEMSAQDRNVAGIKLGTNPINRTSTFPTIVDNPWKELTIIDCVPHDMHH